MAANKNLKTFLLSIFLIKIFGIYFATQVFHTYSPLIDANLYIDEYFVGHGGQGRVKFIQNLVIFLKLFFSNDFLIHLFFGILSLIGFIYGIFKKLVSPIIILTLLFPSSLIWTSVVGKEAVFFGFFTLIIFIWVSYCFDKINKIDLFLLLTAITICTVLRPHYTLGLAWLFLSLIIIKHLIKYKIIILLPLFGLVCFFCFTFFYSDEVLWKIMKMIDFEARSSRFQYFDIRNLIYLYDHQYQGIDGESLPKLAFYDSITLDFKQAISKYWVFSIIGPLPVELLNRYEFIPFFVEGCIIFFSPFIIYLVSLMNKEVCLKKINLLFYYMIFPSLIILVIIHSPFGILNLGSGIRWRVNFETTFYLIPLLIYLNHKHIKVDK